MHDTPQSWIRAVIDCARDGGTLASLQTREEADLVVNLLSGMNLNYWFALCLLKVAFIVFKGALPDL